MELFTLTLLLLVIILWVFSVLLIPSTFLVITLTLIFFAISMKLLGKMFLSGE